MSYITCIFCLKVEDSNCFGVINYTVILSHTETGQEVTRIDTQNTSYTFTDLNAVTNYTVRVTATNAEGKQSSQETIYLTKELGNNVFNIIILLAGANFRLPDEIHYRNARTEF